MSHWNYRIVKTNHTHGPMWGVYEVYYNEFGEPNGRTMDPIDFVDEENPDNIIEMLERALDTIRHTEVLTDDDLDATMATDKGES